METSQRLSLDSLENSLDPTGCQDDVVPFPDFFDDVVHPPADPFIHLPTLRIPRSPLPEGDQSEDGQSVGSSDSELPTIYEDMDDDLEPGSQPEPVGRRTRSRASEGDRSQESEGDTKEQPPSDPEPTVKPRTVKRKRNTKHVRQSRQRPTTRSSLIKSQTRSQPKPRYAATYQGQRH